MKRLEKSASAFRLYIHSRILILFLLLIGQTAAPQKRAFCLDRPLRGSVGLAFHDFNGVVYLPAPEITQRLGIGWAREPFLWDRIEPQKDQWSWGKTDQIVQAAHAEGVEILPLLAYTALWAASIPGNWLSPPKHVEDWVDLVERVLARYSRPPFNLRYFQVWNEPSTRGFWAGAPTESFSTQSICLPPRSFVAITVTWSLEAGLTLTVWVNSMICLPIAIPGGGRTLWMSTTTETLPGSTSMTGG